MIFGVNSIADVVDSVLRNLTLSDNLNGTTLENASDIEVKIAIHFILNDNATDGLKDSFLME